MTYEQYKAWWNMVCFLNRIKAISDKNATAYLDKINDLEFEAWTKGK